MLQLSRPLENVESRSLTDTAYRLLAGLRGYAVSQQLVADDGVQRDRLWLAAWAALEPAVDDHVQAGCVDVFVSPEAFFDSLEE